MQIGHFLMTIKICYICEKDTVTDAVSTHEVEYKGIKKDLPLHHTLCSYCESESAGSKHLSLNKEIVLNFRKEVDESLNKPLRGMFPHVLYLDDSSYIEDIKND